MSTVYQKGSGLSSAKARIWHTQKRGERARRFSTPRVPPLHKSRTESCMAVAFSFDTVMLTAVQCGVVCRSEAKHLSSAKRDPSPVLRTASSHASGCAGPLCHSAGHRAHLLAIELQSSYNGHNRTAERALLCRTLRVPHVSCVACLWRPGGHVRGLRRSDALSCPSGTLTSCPLCPLWLGYLRRRSYVHYQGL